MEPVIRHAWRTERRSVGRVTTLLAMSLGLALSSCAGDDAPPSTESVATAESPAETEEPMDDEPTDDEPAADESMDDQPTDESADDTADGVYRAYSDEAVAEAGYPTTILFFHASWCPECRAFEQAIEDSEIPAGVQILKVDYDSATELKQRYDVTMQTTFVRVDDGGEAQGTWVGYGKDRSLEAILTELG
ncbi:thioredoxin family protein [Phytoactinopolyspora alkaliphila]|uniref:Thioredoxin family protein n=1 Tax=Phytoactinopolyspora alkaliphila TaxID=1783498 RepID=A0A6N9YLE9_9ACTN|nr:thioredoxin family protein [Phytoactinopolyspora alkaliphila]NED95814.1 thioredoxin family protein [Phytoactinopolyspora alkaliphila]